MQVIKNTLAAIAVKNAGISDLGLKDTNIFIWGQDQLSVSKVAASFKKEIDSEFFVIKTAFIDGAVADVAKVEALATMPSRD